MARSGAVAAMSGRAAPSQRQPKLLFDLDDGEERRYTAQDEPILGNSGELRDRILDHADPEVIQIYVEDSDFYRLWDSPLPAHEIGLVHGDDSRTVDLMPGFSHLVSGAGTIEVRSSVWMARTRGMY